MTVTNKETGKAWNVDAGRSHLGFFITPASPISTILPPASPTNYGP